MHEGLHGGPECGIARIRDKLSTTFILIEVPGLVTTERKKNTYIYTDTHRQPDYKQPMEKVIADIEFRQ